MNLNLKKQLPLVSVCVTAYQHVDFIEECIESILMQKTTFQYEIIIGEDESTDGTREICINYANKYPDKIRLFLRNRKDVIYINGIATGRYNFLENLKASKGKYFVKFDGDDYWTDASKLEKQVMFLESNPSFNIVGHNAHIVKNSKQEDSLVKNLNNYTYDITTSDLLQKNPFIASMTMFRKIDFSKLMPVLEETLVADWPLFTYLSFYGKCRFYNESVGCYRLHSNSLTSDYRKKYSKYVIDLISRLEHARFWNKFSCYKFNEVERSVIQKRSRQICNIALRNLDVKNAIKYSPYINTHELKYIHSKVIVKALKLIYCLLNRIKIICVAI